MELLISLNNKQIKMVIKILKSENHKLKAAIESCTQRLPSEQFIAKHEAHIAKMESEVLEIKAIISVLEQTK